MEKYRSDLLVIMNNRYLCNASETCYIRLNASANDSTTECLRDPPGCLNEFLPLNRTNNIPVPVCRECPFYNVSDVPTNNYFGNESTPKQSVPYFCKHTNLPCVRVALLLDHSPANVYDAMNVSVSSSTADVVIMNESNETPVPGYFLTNDTSFPLLLRGKNGSAFSANITATYNEPVYDSWAAWSGCSVSCGSGTQYRSRVPLLSSGAKTSLRENRSCTMIPCPPVCVFGAWGAWSACSATCSAFGLPRPRSVKTRTTSVNHVSCEAQTVVYRDCNVSDCPQNCVFSQLRVVPCDVRCGGGTMRYVYDIRLNSSGGGVPCPVSRTVKCNTHACQSAVTTDAHYARQGAWVTGVALVLMVGHSFASVNRA